MFIITILKIFCVAIFLYIFFLHFFNLYAIITFYHVLWYYCNISDAKTLICITELYDYYIHIQRYVHSTSR